ncbi:acyl--CoA ligase [Lysobacter hankyongensis]|uniref:Acyl--CoA ligase n=1 Tax=Lysobacter hankyongensis TaxID=1176535 RepID=A0ABP9AJV9_9GAMM
MLADLGYGRGDRIAFALDSSADTAIVLLGIAAHATAAPLNPLYRSAEFEFYLSDLDVAAIVLPEGEGDEARIAAAALGVEVIDLVRDPRGAIGGFSLRASTPALDSGARRVPVPERARPEDIALVLHTSGTTAKPKIVPLTHAAICITSANIARTLHLAPGDRCLNVMPLFHVHGILNVLWSSLLSGAAICCLPAFDPHRFWRWYDAIRPSWYSAVPTIHQTVLMHRSGSALAASRGNQSLRFVRSSSAPLAPAVFEELESVFGVPVIESYGMSEVDQIASNPLPPARRKPGSVGLPGGPEVAVMDDRGERLPAGHVGEVCVRGANVLTRYEASDEVNADSFRDGFFRTGDLGYFDADGYLYLVGRLKEIINRGGEKIAPREIDDVALTHPAVAEAAAFALPHPQLGEEPALAVVLRTGADASPLDIRVHISHRLAEFKIPRVVFFLDRLPKGPTGKLKRNELGRQCSVSLPATAATKSSGPDAGASGSGAPNSVHALEQALIPLWEEVLGVKPIAVDDDFLAIGGTSLLATQLFAKIERHFGRHLPIEAVLGSSTIAELAAALDADGWNAPVVALTQARESFADA